MMKRFLIPVSLLLIWIGAHVPALIYGTRDLPLHMSYVGDEQAPVNGALHILADKDLLALRNLKTVYYGPIFSLIAIPGVGFDFIEKYLRGQVVSSEDYKNFVLWSWGGIVWKVRLIALLFGIFGITALFALLKTATINPSKNRWLPWIGAALLATNFYYFEYETFFRHWAFIVPLLLCQLYCLVKLEETGHRRYWYYSLGLFSTVFGISYVGAMFQLMWLPMIISWIKSRNWPKLKSFGLYCGGVACVIALIIIWHPHAFNRIVGIVDSDITNTSAAAYTTEVQAAGYSLGYYSSLLTINNLGLFLAILILIFVLWRPSHLLSQKWLWVIASPGALFFVVFSVVSHHESRYMLPVIVLSIAILGYLVAQYLTLPNRPRLLSITLIALVAYYALFHIVHIGRWLTIEFAGPKEQVLISELVDFQKMHPDSRMLMFQYYILGYVHTKEAYQAYASETGKQDLNLYKALASTLPPSGVTQINIYYRRPDAPALSESELAKYDRIVYKFDPALEDLSREPDYFDANLLRFWSYDLLSEQYQHIR